MKTLDKLMMTIVGLLCFCVSAAALIFALAFLPILGVPAIAQASGAYGLLCKVLFVLVLLMPKVWILLPKRGE